MRFNDYYRVEISAGTKTKSFWASRVSKGTFRKVNREGGWKGNTLEIVMGLPEDFISIQPARLNLVYGTLEVIKKEPKEL